MFAAAGVAAVVLFLADNRRLLLSQEAGVTAIERNEAGAGKRKEKLQVQTDDLREHITLEIEAEQLTKEEVREELERVGNELETRILGENQSLDEVRSDLELMTEIQDSGIQVAWELDNYEVMNLQGELQPEALTESGVLLKLDAYLSYGEEKAQHTFYANLYPPMLSKTEQWIQKLKKELKQSDEETKEERRMTLPKQVDGKDIVWSYEKNFRAGGVLFLGLVFSLFLYVSEQQKEKMEEQQKLRQMELDYPQLINQFTLYIGAGMPVRKAWFKMAEDYERHKKEKGVHAVYEEMVYTMHEIQSGTSEQECYEKFGERCNLTMYRKFGLLLSQNLKKGTKGLTGLLKQESVNTFEERRNLAKKLGEEASTKLLMPMFLMFVMVLAIIVVPAFVSMKM